MSYRIDPGLALDAEVRRTAREQIDKASAELAAPATGGGDPHEAIHDARKRFKKLRALLRLVRSGDEAFHRAENARLRDVARTLSAVRDRTALLESLAALEAGVPATLAAKSVRPAFAAVRKGLEARRRAALATEADLPGTIAAALASLAEARAAVEALAFAKPARRGPAIVAAGYASTHARAREALKRSQASGTAEDRHALRRHVKYLGFHLTLLSPLWPEAFAPMRETAVAIADALGRDHDYALLAEELSATGEAGALAAPGHAGLVLALIESRQAELQSAALAAARRLLAEKPKAARARLLRLFRDAAAAAPPAVPSLAGSAGEPAAQEVSAAAE